MGVLEVRALSGAEVSVLVCTRGSALRWIGGGLGCYSRYYNITHISLRACMLCMYWHGILKGTRAWRYNSARWRRRYCHWKLWYLFPNRTWSVRFFYIPRTNKASQVCAMCKMLLFWAKTGKASVYFLRFDINLKKPRSEFDLVTVLVSKQSFFQHRIWPV